MFVGDAGHVGHALHQGLIGGRVSPLDGHHHERGRCSLHLARPFDRRPERARHGDRQLVAVGTGEAGGRHHGLRRVEGERAPRRVATDGSGDRGGAEVDTEGIGGHGGYLAE